MKVNQQIKFHGDRWVGVGGSVGGRLAVWLVAGRPMWLADWLAGGSVGWLGGREGGGSGGGGVGTLCPECRHGPSTHPPANPKVRLG